MVKRGVCCKINCTSLSLLQNLPDNALCQEACSDRAWDIIPPFLQVGAFPHVPVCTAPFHRRIQRTRRIRRRSGVGTACEAPLLRGVSAGRRGGGSFDCPVHPVKHPPIAHGTPGPLFPQKSLSVAECKIGGYTVLRRYCGANRNICSATTRAAVRPQHGSDLQASLLLPPLRTALYGFAALADQDPCRGCCSSGPDVAAVRCAHAGRPACTCHSRPAGPPVADDCVLSLT